MTRPEAMLLGLWCHFLGDYLIQSHWMAQEKTKRWWPAVAHAATYAVPFLLITQNLFALGLIGGTHAVIDRYRLARYVVWLKNQMAPRRARVTWSASTATGYPNSDPPWLTVWLMIAADNTIHITINSLTLRWVS
jgi:hypothetical protein